MADFVIPTDSEIPLENFDIILTSSSFTFQMQYNSREDSWYFNLLSTDTQQDLRDGVKIVVNQSLMSSFRDITLRPLGHIVAINNELKNIDPGFEDLGNNVQLIYSEF